MTFLISVAISHLSCHKNITPILYLWVKSNPIIKGYFSFMHMIKSGLKLYSLMSDVKGTTHIGPKVVTLAVFTHYVFVSYPLCLIFS